PGSPCARRPFPARRPPGRSGAGPGRAAFPSWFPPRCGEKGKAGKQPEPAAPARACSCWRGGLGGGAARVPPLVGRRAEVDLLPEVVFVVFLVRTLLPVRQPDRLLGVVVLARRRGRRGGPDRGQRRRGGAGRRGRGSGRRGRGAFRRGH